MDILIIGLLFIVAFFWALWSTADLGFGHHIERIIARKKVKGSIVFLDDKIVHYSSDSSSSSS